MASDETLRMAAEILDKWSGPLKEMTKAVKNVSDLTTKQHVEGSKQATDHTNKLWLLRREWVTLAGNMKSLVSPALSEMSLALGGIGVGAAGIGIGVAAAIASIKSFGNTAATIAGVASQVKLTKDEVLKWQIVADGMGISTEEMNSSLKDFSGLLDGIARGAPLAIARLHSGMPKLYEALGRDEFLKLTRDQQLKRAIQVVRTEPDADKRRIAFRVLGIPENFAGLMEDEIKKVFDAADEVMAREGGKLDWAKGFNANVAFNKIASEMGILKNRVAGGLLNLPTFNGPTGGVTTNLPPTFSERLPAVSQWMEHFWDRSKGNINPLTGGSSATEGPAVRQGGGVSPDIRMPRFPAKEDLEKSIEKGTESGSEKGIFQGLKNWFFQKTSFERGTGGEGGGTTTAGGGRYKVAVPSGEGGGEAPVPAAFHPGGGVSPTGEAPAGAGEGLGGSEYLRARRARFAAELNADPALKNELAGVVSMEHESDPTAVTESLMNRMDYSQGSIKSGLHSGFYGPVNRGMLPSQVAKLQRDPARMARINKGIDAALGGSNLLQGATDQGSGNDPNAHWQGGRVMRGGEIYNDWGGGPGGHAGAAAFRERQQRAVREGGASKFGGGAYPANVETFGPPKPPPSLLDHARDSGMLGGKIGGSASVELSLEGFPRGTKSSSGTDGIFSEVRINRGYPGSLADRDDSYSRV